jgi:hypothetical protein
VALGAALSAVGLGALVMGMSLFSGFPRMALAAGVGAGFLGTVVVWVSLRLCRTATGATRLCLAGSVAAGVIDVLAASLVAGLYPGSNRFIDASVPDAVAGVWAVAISSLVYGAPPGLVFGAFFVMPVRRVHALSRDKAIEVGDLAVRLCGGWLFIVCAGCALLGAIMTPSLERSGTVEAVLLAASGAIGLVGAAASVVAHVRIGRRQRWFERVQAGKEPGWTIAPRTFFAEGLDDLQPLFAARSNHNVVLVRHEAASGGGAYRNASNLVPKALVHLPEGLAALSFSLPNEEQERALDRLG